MKFRILLFVGVLLVMILAAGLLFSRDDGSVTVTKSNNSGYLVE